MRRPATLALVLTSVCLLQTAWANSGEQLELREPRGIDIDSVDRVVVAYAASHVVAVYSPEGRLLRVLGRLDEPGNDNAHFNGPYGVTVDAGDRLYVADTGNDRLCVFDAEGTFLRAIGDADGPGKLNKPRGCELDEDGNVLVADTGNNRIAAFNPEGKYLPERSVDGDAAKELKAPSNLVLQSYFSGGTQRLMVANAGVGRLDEFEWRDVEIKVNGEKKTERRWVWAKEYGDNPDVTDLASGREYDVVTACPGWNAVRRWDVHMHYKWDTIQSVYSTSLWGIEGQGIAHLDVKPYGIALDSTDRVFVTWPEASRIIRYTDAMLDPSRPEITHIRPTSILVNYESLVPVASAVEYSLDGVTWTTVEGRGRLTSRHAVKLTGLQPGTQYRFRVQYGCSFVPKTPFWGREWRFATAAPKGMVRYLDMPVLVVLYKDIYDPAKVPDGVEPPTALTDEGVATVKAQLEQGAYGYYFASRWLMNVHFDWVVVDAPQLIVPDPKALETLSAEDRARFDALIGRASQRGLAERTDENRAELTAFLKEKLGDAVPDKQIGWLTAPNRWPEGANWIWDTEALYDRLCQEQLGTRLLDYAGCISLGCEWSWHDGEPPNDLAPGRIQPAVHTDAADPPDVHGFWRQAGSGGLTPFWWGNNVGKAIGRCAFNTGGDTIGLFFHEFGHKVDGQFIYSGYQDFAFNHWGMSYLEGRFDGGLSGNGYVLRIFPTEYYFASVLGEVKLAPDADGDGLADEDPGLWCDEVRFGSSPHSRDTDGDGLKDYDEMLATCGVQAVVFERERMIERLVPPRPDLADSDRDGIPDGRDPYPLYPVPATIAKRTPVLDGRITPGEWNVYRTFNDGELIGTFYMAWDDENLYLALAADRWAEIIAKFDFAQDGFTWGRDNMYLNVIADTRDPMAEPPACRIELRVNDAAFRGPDVRDNERNRRLYDPARIRAVTGAMGEVKVVEVALPRNRRVSLEPRPGMAFDFGGSFRPVGGGSLLNLFERDWAVGVTLVDGKKGNAGP